MQEVYQEKALIRNSDVQSLHFLCNANNEIPVSELQTLKSAWELAQKRYESEPTFENQGRLAVASTAYKALLWQTDLKSETDLKRIQKIDLVQAQLALEPFRLYHADTVNPRARFALCTKQGSGAMNQELFDVSDLDWVMRQIAKNPHRDRLNHWISQATLRPGAVNRRIPSIILLNAIWIDIDISHPPSTFPKEAIDRLLAGKTMAQRADALTKLLLSHIQEIGLPEPTLVISTGGGLCAKWVFQTAIAAAARPRWQSLEHKLVEKLEKFSRDGVSWPVDHKACDASRILRLPETNNPKWNELCRITHDSGKNWDFETLADQILPYTRAEVAEFRANAKKFAQYDKNKEEAAAAGIGRQGKGAKKPATSFATIGSEAGRELWSKRLQIGMRLIEARGGVIAPGDRHGQWFPLSNALAYSCTTAEALAYELSALYQSHFLASNTPSSPFARIEALQSVKTLIKKQKEGGELYKMYTATFLGEKHFNASQSEMDMLRQEGLLEAGSGHNAKRDEWNVGAMGFEKPANLSAKAFIKLTRERQALAGPRSAEIRSTTKPLDLRQKALLMKNSGCTQAEIAKELNVGQGTVSKWLKAAK